MQIFTNMYILIDFIYSIHSIQLISNQSTHDMHIYFETL